MLRALSGLLIVCFLFTAGPSRADDGDVAAAATPAPTQPQLFRIRSVELVGVSGKAVTEQEILRRTVRVREADGYLTVAEGDGGRDIAIGQIGSDDGVLADAALVRAIASEAFRAYADRKIAAVRVTIPQDTIPRLTTETGDGVLAVAVTEGAVARVRTMKRNKGEVSEAGDGWYTHVAGQSPVGEDDVVHLTEIDRHVYWLNRHPGRRVDVALTPDPAGNLSLDYIVTVTQPWTAYAQVSNTGTDSTGKWRLRLGFLHNNLSGVDDVLAIDYVSDGFDDVHAVTTSYQRPLPGLYRTTVRVAGTYSEYTAADVGLAGLDLLGEGYTVSLEVIRNVHQQERLFVDIVAGLRFEHSRVDNEATMVIGDTDFLLPYVSVRLDTRTDSSTTTASITFETNLSGLAGTDADEVVELGRSDADTTWVAMKFSASHNFYIEPLVKKNWGEPDSGSTLAHEVSLAIRGQIIFGDDRVAPTFTQVVGGFYTVRGYPESYTAADNVVIATFEYRLHIPRLFKPGEPTTLLGQPFHVRPKQQLAPTDWDLVFRTFLDVGRTVHNDREPFEKNVTAVGAGIGVQVQLKSNVSVTFDWGIALNDTDNGSSRVDAGSSRGHVMLLVSY